MAALHGVSPDLMGNIPGFHTQHEIVPFAMLTSYKNWLRTIRGVFDRSRSLIDVFL